MQVTYAGVPINSYTEEMAAHVSAYCNPNEVLNFQPTAPSHDLWPLPIPHIPPLPPVIPNILHWPSDASRFSTFFMMMDEQQVNQLRSICLTNYGSQPQSLVFTPNSNSQGNLDGESLTVTMYMLPPRPLAQIPGFADLWLVPLVDQRYFWWFQNTNFNSFSSWASLFSQIKTNLNIVTLNQSTIPTAYGTKPSQRFVMYGQPIPLYFDALAYTLGMRITVGFNGAVNVQSYDDATVVEKSQYLGYVYVLTLGIQTGGTYTLTFEGQTTTVLSGILSTALIVQAALEALSTVGVGNVVVDGPPGGPFIIQLNDSIVPDYEFLTADFNSLSFPFNADLAYYPTFINNRALISGYNFYVPDVTKSIIPATVSTMFSQTEANGTINVMPLTVNTSLLSLNLIEYEGITGFAGEKTLLGDMPANYPGTIILTLGSQSSGYFYLIFLGDVTPPLQYNTSASQIQSALENLNSIGISNVTVTGSIGGPFTIILSNSVRGSSNPMTGYFSPLSNPGNASITDVPSNLTNLTNYADQASTDWYLWQLANDDCYFAGIVNWEPNGLIDLIEIRAYNSKQTTRVSRRPYNDLVWGYVSPLNRSASTPIPNRPPNNNPCDCEFNGSYCVLPNYKPYYAQLLGHDEFGCLVWYDIEYCQTPNRSSISSTSQGGGSVSNINCGNNSIPSTLYGIIYLGRFSGNPCECMATPITNPFVLTYGPATEYGPGWLANNVPTVCSAGGAGNQTMTVGMICLTSVGGSSLIAWLQCSETGNQDGFVQGSDSVLIVQYNPFLFVGLPFGYSETGSAASCCPDYKYYLVISSQNPPPVPPGL